MKYVIVYVSRSLSKVERNYLVYKLEFFVLKWFVKEKFKEYLYGYKFIVYMDNNLFMYL